MSEKDDDWDFKVDRSLSANDEPPAPKMSKKKRLEEIAQAFSDETTAPSDLTLDHAGTIPRRERIENFKKSHALEKFKEIKTAPLDRRLFATIVDVFFVSALIYAGLKFFPFIQTHVEKALPPGFLGQVPYPQKVLEFTLPALLVFFFHLVPTAISKKSIGKKLFSLRVGNKFEDSGTSKFVVFIRELIIKPISCLSIIGILCMFINLKRRTLHDFICSTAVYDEN